MNRTYCNKICNNSKKNFKKKAVKVDSFKNHDSIEAKKNISPKAKSDSLDPSSMVASSEDIDSFNKAMSKDQTNHKNGFLNDSHYAKDDSANSDTLNEISSIFSSLLAHDEKKPAPAQNPIIDNNSMPLEIEDREKLNTLADKLIDKILVSDPKYNATSQVRFTLSDNSAFANMEVVIKRSLDGSLAVEIYTKNKNQTKDVNNIHQDLVQSLEKHEKGIVNICIIEEIENNSSMQDEDAFNNYIKPY